MDGNLCRYLLLLASFIFIQSATSKLNNVLLVADTKVPGIFTSTLPSANGRQRLVVPQLIGAVSLDYDRANDRVYAGAFTIDRNWGLASFDSSGSNFTFRIFPEASTLTAVAVDYLSDLVYYADSGENLIGVRSLNLSYTKHIIYNATDITNMCLDPPRGKLYFSTYGDNGGRLVEASMDGQNLRVIRTLSSRSSGFLHLACDSPARSLYWSEFSTAGSKVRRYDHDNGQVTDIISIPILQAIDEAIITFTVDRFYLYAAHVNSKILSRYNKDGSSKQQYAGVPLGNSTIVDMVPISDYTELSGTTSCSTNNGGCQQLCLPRPGGRTCACTDGYVLQSDNTCDISPFDHILVVSDAVRGGLFVNDVATNASFRLNVYGLDGTRGITYADRYMYWVDQDSELLGRACLAGSCPPSVLKQWRDRTLGVMQTRLEDIEIDRTTGNIYIVDSFKRKIFRVNNRTLTQTDVITSNLQRPKGLALDVSRGLMFWTDAGPPAKIESASLRTGSGRQTVISTGLLEPVDIVLDPVTQEIYWCDMRTFKIEKASYDGSNRKMVLQNLLIYTSLTIDNNYLYFKDFHTKSIQRVNRFTGKDLQVVGPPAYVSVTDMMVIGGPPTGPSVTTTSRLPPTPAPTPPPVPPRVTSPTRMPSTSGQLLYTDKERRHVYISDLLGQNETEFFRDPFTNPTSVDFDFRRKIMVLLERGTTNRKSRKGLITINVRTKRVNVMLLPGRSEPDTVHLDPVSELIYYTDKQQHRIVAVSYDLRTVKVILYNDKGLGGIAVDPIEGKIFYTVYTTSGVQKTGIHSANGDGTNLNTIIDQDTGHITRLALDRTAKMIYFTDASGNKIERCTYFGRSRQVLIDRSAQRTQFYAIAVDESHMYYSTGKGKNIYRAGKDGRNMQALGPPIRNESFITSIRIIKSSLVRNGSNACSQNNGGCAQICLPRPGGRTCACGTKFILDGNGRTCTVSQFSKILVVTDKQSSGIFVIDVASSATFRVSVESEAHALAPSGIAWYDGTFFWVDNGTLYTGCWNQQDCIQELKTWPGGRSIAHIAIDRNDKHIYLVDTAQRMIFRMNLGAQSSKTIVNTGVGEPRGLALDPTRRTLFWTNIGRNPSIERASMDDGSCRVTIIDTGLSSPNFIVVDPDQALMYWCDGGTKNVEVATMDGLNRKVLYSKDYTFLSLAIDKDYLYVFGVSLTVQNRLIRINRIMGTGEQSVGAEPFKQLYAMVYVDTLAAPPANTVKPALSCSGVTQGSTPVPNPGGNGNPAPAPGGNGNLTPAPGGDGNPNSQSSSGGLDKDTILYIGIGVAAAVLLLIIIIVIFIVCCLLSKRKKKVKSRTEAANNVPLQQAPQQAPPTQPQAQVPKQTSETQPPPYQPESQLLAQQLHQQTEQQRQQQAQMFMMQQQLLLLQAQQIQNTKKADTQPQPESQADDKKPFRKPPMPLPTEDTSNSLTVPPASGEHALYSNLEAEKPLRPDGSPYLNMRQASTE